MAHITIDRARLRRLLERERVRFSERHPRSRELFAETSETLLGGVPMSWMTMWAGGFPLFFADARGARIEDVDGNSLIDFCLGDTGAMAGHAPEPTVPRWQSRMAARSAYERLVRVIEWKLIEMPLPRLQVMGQSQRPFIYEINWSQHVVQSDVVRYQTGEASTFDNRVLFKLGVGESFCSSPAFCAR